MKLPKFLGGFQINYVYLIPISIFLAKVIEVVFQAYGLEFASPPLETGNWFISNFIEWFGAVYGILVTLVLVRVWEQFDDIDREFDREADTVKSLYEDMLFLRGKNAIVGKDIIKLLRNYVEHVLNNYHKELKKTSDRRMGDTGTTETVRRHFVDAIGKYLIRIGNQIMKSKRSDSVKIESDDKHAVGNNIAEQTEKLDDKVTADFAQLSNERQKGDLMLQDIRHEFKRLLNSNVMRGKASEFLVKELFHQLNELIDIRGDRIGLVSQRLFDTLRFVVLVTSIIYVIPFYFVSLFPFPVGLLDDILVAGVTLLVIFIYLTIEDFDEPFYGTWRISDESWQRLLDEMNSDALKSAPNSVGENVQKQTSSDH